MSFREISFSEFIKPKEDPGKNYPFNPKPIDKIYSDFSAISRFNYGSLDKKSIGAVSYSPKSFSGAYRIGGSSSYASSSPKFSSGNYKMAA